MPDLENHPMREPLTQLIHHYNQLVEERAIETNERGLVPIEDEGTNEEQNDEEKEVLKRRNDFESENLEKSTHFQYIYYEMSSVMKYLLYFIISI